MFGLLYKELIIHKKQLLMILPIIVFALGWTIVPVQTTPDLNEWELDLVLGMVSVMIMLTLEMFESGIMEGDERKKWQDYIVSVKDGIHMQIAAKYVFNAALSCSMVVIMTIFFSAASAVNGTDITIINVLLMQLLWLQLLIRALEMPFLVRFGTKQGNLFRMVLIGAVTMGLIVYGLFGDLSVFGSLESFLKWMKDFLTDESSTILRLTPAVTWVLYYLSYRISCRLYLKGGEYYDK